MAFRRFTGMARAQATSRLGGSRRPHGDAHAAAANATGLWGAYLRAAANYPLYTALGTSATLWAIGDTVAQVLEGKESSEGHGKKPEGEHGNSAAGKGGLDFRRLAATVTEGSAVGGAAGLYWYAFLDRFVSGTMGLTSGIHSHGFPGFGEPAHDVRGESSSTFVERKRALLPSSAAKICYERLLLPSALRDVERQWSRMDPEGKGSVSAQQLEKFLAQSPLSGLPDANVNAVAARLLVKHAGTGRSLTKKQYIDFVTKLHSTAFRESFLDEVVFSLFDADQNGVIDAKEAKIFCQVMLNGEEGHQDVFKEADTDHSGSLSFDDVQQLLKKIRANIK